MPAQEPENGPSWNERAQLPGLSGVLDPADTTGLKNELIDRTQKLALRWEIRPVRGLHVLDLGCGNGRLSLWLARCGALVEGVDPAPEMVRAARDRVPGGVFSAGDAEDIPRADASFELVLTAGVLQYLAPEPPRLARAVGEIVRVLRPTGQFLALEQVREADLARGAPRDEYEAAFRGGGLTVQRAYPVRLSDSRVARRIVDHHRLSQHVWLPALVMMEAQLLRWTPLTGGRYADYMFVCRRA